MTTSPNERWSRVRDLMRDINIQKDAMMNGASDHARDLGTQGYVRLVDQLVDELTELDDNGTLADIGKGLEAVYGRVGG